MGSGLSLQVILGVPVRVEDDYSVGWGEIDAQSSGTGGQEETKILDVGEEHEQRKGLRELLDWWYIDKCVQV